MLFPVYFELFTDIVYIGMSDEIGVVKRFESIHISDSIFGFKQILKPRKCDIDTLFKFVGLHPAIL